MSQGTTSRGGTGTRPWKRLTTPTDATHWRPLPESWFDPGERPQSTPPRPGVRRDPDNPLGPSGTGRPERRVSKSRERRGESGVRDGSHRGSRWSSSPGPGRTGRMCPCTFRHRGYDNQDPDLSGRWTDPDPLGSKGGGWDSTTLRTE